MHTIFHDEIGRYVISSTTGSDGTTFFFDGTGRHIFVFTTGRDGTHIVIGIRIYVNEGKIESRK